MITHWICFGILDGQPCAVADPRQAFDDACDDMVEAIDKGDCDDARVYRLDFGAGGLIDVTADARRRVRQWMDQRRQAYPDWLQESRIAAE